MDDPLFFDRDLETLDRERLGRLRDRRVRALVAEISANEFFRAKLAGAGLTPEDVRGAADLAAVPFTTKAELVEEQLARPPFGRLLTHPLSRYRYRHQTSGTTAAPLVWLDTEEDWAWWMRCWGFVYRGAGVTDEDVVFCAFSFGPYISHWTAIAGARSAGALAVSGGGQTSPQRLRAIAETRATVLVCTPTYALHLAEVAAEYRVDVRASSVRTTIHAGEPGASVPNVRRRIEEAWGARCHDHAGATEVGAWAFDCPAADGAVHLNEAEFVFEVIDPATAEPVAEGSRGELVVTSLGRTGMPAVRYRTGDLVELTAEPCACGRTFARAVGGVLGRADDMMIVRGVNLYPSGVDDIVRGVDGVVEYEVELRRRASMTDLAIRVETEEGAFRRVAQSIGEAFRLRHSLRVTVERAERGSLPRYEFKARRYKTVEAE
jgi:phenylacetate-CoA ligase